MPLTDKKSVLQLRLTRRNWRKPGTLANWLWLACSMLIYAGVSLWYFSDLKTQRYPGPSVDPLRLYGIVAFVMVLLTGAYTLRRRFIRVLPWSVQDWLWLHTWFGIGSILIACMHANYLGILNGYRFTLSRFTESGFGMSALYSLLLLVISGMIGRLLDLWLARVIASEARSNGVGIIQALEDRLHESTLLIERLSAGKSEAFKAAVAGMGASSPLPVQEQADLIRVQTILNGQRPLQHSLHRQQRAQRILRLWRWIHIPLACLALCIIGFHSLLELAKMALQVIVYHMPL